MPISTTRATHASNSFPPTAWKKPNGKPWHSAPPSNNTKTTPSCTGPWAKPEPPTPPCNWPTASISANWRVGDKPPTAYRIRYPRVYWDEVVALGEELELDPFLILAVARQESTYRPNLTSIAGARGVMQLMPDTASWLARIDERITDQHASHLSTPQHALRIGAVYLKRLMLRSDHNLVYALASYNAGPGNCDKWRRRFGEIPPDEFIEKIPFGETKNYVKRILAHYATYHSLYK